MTTEVENQEVQTGADTTNTAAVTQTQTDLSLEQAKARIAELEKTAADKTSLLRQVRKYENEAKTRANAALAEQGKYKELYEAATAKYADLEQRFTAKVVDGELEKALVEAKASSISTVLKLIDRKSIQIDDDGVVVQSSINDAISKLKESDPVLFGTVAKSVPKIARAVEGESSGKKLSSTDRIAQALKSRS